ncbi:hypothetical protein [Clostridium cellulovorans]|uniref:Uncharacterized protein n=1 Tax=Clostridium cellulovorans (strain ATCC 35296 / DSM 3052 / OCM 3 / 743B) TaxID=573061 RepID=D9SNC3_CLOC7|nr:hypothetical protein [Clostridium cellulovorans]ADL53915.1 hypothetical protein Clocel_4254 [Clostridium cellulovorans 743B]
MRNMREELIKIGDMVIGEIGNEAVKLGDRARGLCLFLNVYEPVIPIELLDDIE